MDILERYKFGLVAALLVYVTIFMYLHMKSVPQAVPYEPFYDGAIVKIPEEDIELKPENIMVPPEFSGDVKNMSRDANDQRERSYENYSQNMSSGRQMEQSVYDYEQQLFNETGGAEARRQIQEQMEKRKQQEKQQTSGKPNTNNSSSGTDRAYKGSVMVDFSVTSRTAYQNNNWYVRNPGYTCPAGSSGRVLVNVKVNANGDVITAEYDPAQSSGATSCMIEQALKYAKMSRFSYLASSTSSGWISYTFVP